MNAATPNLYVSNNPNPTGGTDPRGRMPEYNAAPAKWVTSCFRMAERAGMNIIIAKPDGQLGPGDFSAGVFLDPEANEQFVIEREAWKTRGVPLSCGLYIGHKLTSTIGLDPENAHTQAFMSGLLLPYLVPGSILGVDAIAATPASKRLYDACQCFGVRYYQEGIPYWKFPTKAGAIPSMGLFSQHLIEDPKLVRKVPKGVDYRLRFDSSNLTPEAPAQVAACKANGFGFDVGSWPGDPAFDKVVAIATGRGPTT